ncbi:uroporphyrinogen-III synthase [Streptococcus himalayensis]|uniref:Uroporphyrinogen-III synthase n=1 Tax=Streptococcus himalayensis TaxID=1888195 RepID=A0A917A8E7_9STRE|nr:uroporphyrinogen-III synthase [Streptococcus himalayensis]GGE33879.1 uroporphyrinogen-III synthase [Streptococcus himalayensis]
MTKTVVFTREHPLDNHLQTQLEAVGFRVRHLPLIHCQPNPMPKEILESIPQMDWVFFTSAIAAEFLLPYLKTPLPQLATIGHQTSRVLTKLGHKIDFESNSQYAKDFAQEWLALGYTTQKILLPQSSLSNPVLAESLREGGHEVLAWPLYDTQYNPVGQGQIPPLLNEEELIWTFASPSAWQSFHAVCEHLPKGHAIAVIGTSTQKAVEADGGVVSMMPTTPSIERMVEEIIRRETL